LKAIGLPDPDHPEYEINYSERSPLVVPPNRSLPAPIATDKPPVANWPQDADLKKRQASKKEPVHVEGDRVIHEGRPPRPDALIVKGSGGGSASRAPRDEAEGGEHPLGVHRFQKRAVRTINRG